MAAGHVSENGGNAALRFLPFKNIASNANKCKAKRNHCGRKNAFLRNKCFGFHFYCGLSKNLIIKEPCVPNMEAVR